MCTLLGTRAGARALSNCRPPNQTRNLLNQLSPETKITEGQVTMMVKHVANGEDLWLWQWMAMWSGTMKPPSSHTQVP
jgi:hypothetical protein